MKLQHTSSLIAPVAIAFLMLCTAPESLAQNGLPDSFRKKGKEPVEKSGSMKSNKPEEDFNREDIISLQAINGAWLEPIGFPSTKGELSPAFRLPAVTSPESEQKKYVQGRPLPQDMTNQALLDEYLALKDWMKKAEDSGKMIIIKDEYGSRPYLLDEELYARASMLGRYAEVRKLLEDEALNEVPGSISPMQNIVGLARILESDEYKRTIKSSAEPLRRYMREEHRKWFDAHGGLGNVDSRSRWVPTSGGLYASTGSPDQAGVPADGRTASGILQADGHILIDGMYFKAYPGGKYAVLEKTNPEYMKGRDVVIPAYIEYEGVKCAVTTIAVEAFRDNGIKSVELPNTITSIRNLAFSGNALTKVVLPSSLKELGQSCFAGDLILSEVVIPESLENLGGYAFADCTSLTSIKLPRRMIQVGACAFMGCTALTSVVMPETVEFNELGDRTFYECGQLRSITIPRGVTVIGNFAFKGCKSLTSVVIPEGVTTIQVQAFWDCTSLKTVTLPKSSLKSIDNGAFEGCTALTSITLPASIKEYGMGIFKGCKSLQSVTMPKIYGTDPARQRKLISIFLYSGIYDNTKGVKMECIDFAD